MFELVTGLEELIDLIVVQTNLCAKQKGRNFTVDNNELKAFLEINYIMAINKLPKIAEYWRVDNRIGNNVIQNTMIRNRFCEILQSLLFAGNTEDDKTDWGFKVRPVIDHLNKNFAKVLSNDEEQCIEEDMVKFKGRSGRNSISNLNLSNGVLRFGVGGLLKLGICTKQTFTKTRNRTQNLT